MSPSFDAAWTGVIRPWLERVGDVWQTSSRNVLLLRSQPQIQAIRARMREEEIHSAGLRFWLPHQAREFLAARSGGRTQLAIRENLHLLLSISSGSGNESPAVKALASDASRLMCSLDALMASGRTLDSAAEHLSASIAKVIAKFTANLSDSGWQTVQQFDWNAFRLASELQTRRAEHPLELDSLLAFGFDGAGWDAWPLLCAMLTRSRDPQIVFTQPRIKAETIDQLWAGSLEQLLGESIVLDEVVQTRPYASLAAKMESPESVQATSSANLLSVLIGRNLAEQSEAVVNQICDWLASGTVTRAGILVPPGGALAREISLGLLDRGILHYTNISSPERPDVERSQGAAWIALQRQQKVAALLDYLKLTTARDALDSFSKTLVEACLEIQTDDLAVLAALFSSRTNSAWQTANELLTGLNVLPAQTTLANFIHATSSAATGNGWTEAARALTSQQDHIGSLLNEELSRSQYLDWLEAITERRETRRDPRTSNPAARVHILTYPEAEGLPWSHLLMAGMNEGHWPPNFDPPGFLTEDTISELNQAAITTGNQGEGHLVIKPGLALILGPAEQRALARRQFYNLVEAPTVALAITASLEDDEDARGLGPSDYLSHLYFTQTGQPLTEERLKHLHTATRNWIEAAPATPQPTDSDTEQTRTAHTARRTPGPFGPYEFALATPPPEPITIACKKWRAALTSPAALWLEEILGVTPRTEPFENDTWPLTTGNWVHRWLSTALAATNPAKLVELRDLPALPARVRQAAHRTRDSIERIFTTLHRPLPDRWHAHWADAAWKAGELAERISTITDWPYAATEWTLPNPTEIKLPRATLRVRGRTDLILAPGEHFTTGTPLWLFDFKTGTDKPLKPTDLHKKLARGDSIIQLALYALALRNLGASNVAITLLTPETEPTPQLTSTDLETLHDFWHALARMQDTGIFGMRGPLRDDYKHTDTLPLATLPIPQDLLEEKWTLTHPLLLTH